MGERHGGSSYEMKGKEKAPSQAKSKRKTPESPFEGAPTKKLLASVRQAAKRVEVRSSYLFRIKGDFIHVGLFY